MDSISRKPIIKEKGLSLPQYVEHLLKIGKTSKHDEFLHLFNMFGKEKIVNIAKEILAKHKEQNVDEEKK